MSRAAPIVGSVAILICGTVASAQEEKVDTIKTLVRNLTANADKGSWPDKTGLERVSAKLAELGQSLESAGAERPLVYLGKAFTEFEVAVMNRDLKSLKQARAKLEAMLDHSKKILAAGEGAGDVAELEFVYKNLEESQERTGNGEGLHTSDPAPAEGVAAELLTMLELLYRDLEESQERTGNGNRAHAPGLVEGLEEAKEEAEAGPEAPRLAGEAQGEVGAIGAAAEEMSVQGLAAAEVPLPTDVEEKSASRARLPSRPRERALEPTILKGLRPAEIVALSTDKVRGEQEVVSLVTSQVTLEFVLTCDGLFRTLDLSGEEGGKVAFELIAGPKTLTWELVVGRGAGTISSWPVSGFTAAAGRGTIGLRLETFAWAFALAAKDVGPEGVEVYCDGATCVLHDGQRLDSQRGEDGEIIFVISGLSWPHEYTLWEFARIKREEGPRPADEPRQAMDSPLRPWQTLFLPVIDLDVLRPEDVSP